MSNLVEYAQGIAGKNPTVQNAASNAKDSIYKLKKETKVNKVDTNTGAPNDVAQLERAILQSGILAPKTIQPSTSTPADYYRRGRKAAPKTGETYSYDKYDYMPRFLTETSPEQPASIRMVGKISSGSKSEAKDLIPPFSRFFLEGFTETWAEKTQIIETFGDSYIFMFGSRPQVYNFTGRLINSDQINWKEDFIYYYENFLRGTKCAEYKARLILTYGLNQIVGYIIATNMQQVASSDLEVPFNFSFYVVDRISMKKSLDFGLVEDNGVFKEAKEIESMLKNGSSDPAVSDAVVTARKVSAAEKLAAAAQKAQADSIKKVTDAISNSKVKIAAIGGKIKVT